jgi:hypothetical protein
MPFKEEPNVLSHLKKLESHIIQLDSIDCSFPLVYNMFSPHIRVVALILQLTML